MHLPILPLNISITTPDKMCSYKQTLQLLKTYKSSEMTSDWIDVNFQKIFNKRMSKFLITSAPNFNVRINRLENKLAVVYNMIELDWLNLSFKSNVKNFRCLK